MQKLKLKSIYKLCKSCSSRHIEHKKIGFAIFGFFYDLIQILQVTRAKGEKLKNLLLRWPMELLNLHTNTLGSCKTDPRGKTLHTRALARRGKLADGKVGPRG
jgi:hypothetical protein